MRIAITGASGNVGMSLVRALQDDGRFESIVGISRRRPGVSLPKVTWVSADVERDDLEPLFASTDVVVHLAWRIQPSHRERELWRTNVVGSERVFVAAARAGVSALVYASSVGVYSPGAGAERIDESWPRDGVSTSFYGRHKAEVERRLDAVETGFPGLRVVRMRPGLVFRRQAASEIRRLFAGPLVPTFLLRRGVLRLVPDIPQLRVQAVHGDDLARAYAEACARDVRGAFNVAAEPVLDAAVLAEALDARRVPVPVRVARGLTAASWHLHLQPSEPGWLDLGLGVPLMSSDRAAQELGWTPSVSALDALLELIEGMRAGAGGPTPPLDPAAGGRFRLGELASGVGAREPEPPR